MMYYKYFNDFGVEFYVVEISDALLLRPKNGRSEASGQIGSSHLVLHAMRGHSVQVFDERLEHFEVERRQHVYETMDFGETIAHVLFFARVQELLIKVKCH